MSASIRADVWATKMKENARNTMVPADQLAHGFLKVPSTVCLLGPSLCGKTASTAQWLIDGTVVDEETGRPVIFDNLIVFATRVEGNEVYATMELALHQQNPSISVKFYDDVTEELLLEQGKKREGWTAVIVDDFMGYPEALKQLTQLVSGRWREQKKTITFFTIQAFFAKDSMTLRNNSRTIIVFPMRNDLQTQNMILRRLAPKDSSKILIKLLNEEPIVGNKIIWTDKQFFNKQFLPVLNPTVGRH